MGGTREKKASNYSNGDKVFLAIESLEEARSSEAYPPIVVILGMELLNTEFRYFVSIGVMDMLPDAVRILLSFYYFEELRYL